MRTIRVRLALTTSLWLSAISAVILAGVYFALTSTIDAAPLDPVTVKKFEHRPDGTLVYRIGESFQAADLASVQRAVNNSTLETLRDYSLLALGVIFLVSLAVGWFVAGRLLRPVEEITRTANRLSASDLSQRINATGPKDELRTLADTIDGMLDRLDEAFRTERALVEDVSHELRNPVAVVQANVEAVLADDDATPEQRAHALAVISRATTRMSRLLEDLLATARRRSGSFSDQRVDLQGFVTDVVDDHRLLAGERPLRLSTRVSPGPVVYADPESLARAVSNLLSNAIRLAPGGSELTVGSGSTAGWAWIAVRDEGPGIAEDDQQRVFDRFRQGATTTERRRGRGSGLGLAIARQIVESHEGKMALFSTLGAGSTFVIWLPDRALADRPERSTQPPTACPL
ncbi:HAMP domain-containing histidine kinase [Mycolicibacterium sp. 018/SC-01/001]|uniref:HAMP domain-containing sensor histidine kinase n=1 Tax=Mycolicibacterium sp. 018/SC-01/001 TaxID=2592069 RepID=UPI00117E976F|nr:HAMP domain-containing sensor histidine kinase [Mycolicibacterium sp. 018/SC-01/001]TRW80765.1 HAMP domain-containing histidine kinase [Mycolicibacterium sp. 018/SC-01/001]